MTREEFRDYVDVLRSQNEISYNVYSELIDGIDTLEQEPCEDAISRQAVLEIQAKYAEDIGATKFWQMRDDIKALPSVTPQQKIGHWIFKNDNVAIPTGYFQCSECNSGKLLHVENYCPSCGVQMESVEQAERSEE